ncbi:ATP-binding protein [Caldimonas brevitalea]|uniref:histidine kinase n=1 Tax=Caldimonas brevitalea TaxID=413882 RepID=A0A0G3BIR0_9BURK|nr:ATP-binding protein [Caldimonas brevitalea]AKJ29309.1 two-component oxygen-sensor histidine kinase FixL [Caldimonas brevitalea]
MPLARVMAWLSCLGLVAGTACASDQAPSDMAVLLLRAADLSWPPPIPFNAAFAEALQSSSSFPVYVYEETIASDMLSVVGGSRLLFDYLTTKYAGRHVDAIVAVGDAALAFVRQNQGMFGAPQIVAVTTGIGATRTEDGYARRLDASPEIGKTLDLALALRPSTRHVFVVDGALRNHGELEAEVRQQMARRRADVRLIYLKDLLPSELDARMAAIPPASIVLFLRQTIGENRQHIHPLQGLSHVVRASKEPVFSVEEAHVGRGVVGGSVWRMETVAKWAADATRRTGSSPKTRDAAVAGVTSSILLDWRELERWNIPEARVPRNSTVLFHPAPPLEPERHDGAAGLLLAVVVVALFAVILVARRARVRAQHEALRMRDRMLHLARFSAMGEVAASLAHELSQPLSAALSNARVADHLLSREHIPVPELKAILQDIVNDNRRAADVIARIRDMVSRRVTERARVDLQEVVRAINRLLASEAARRRVSMRLDLVPGALTVEADRVQLQQVMLNLLLNALDAASLSEGVGREVHVSTRMSDQQTAHIMVSDNGPGLPPGMEQQVFEPFYTTKRSGMGVGLWISRSIVEGHDGRIWATARPGGGADFHVTLPRLPAEGGS